MDKKEKVIEKACKDFPNNDFVTFAISEVLLADVLVEEWKKEKEKRIQPNE